MGDGFYGNPLYGIKYEKVVKDLEKEVRRAIIDGFAPDGQHELRITDAGAAGGHSTVFHMTQPMIRNE